MRKFILVAVAGLLGVSATAQSIDEIQTKDGSVYSGYISEQEPGKQVYIYAENASLKFKEAEMTDLRKDYYNFNLLPETSKQIVRESGDTTSLYLSSFHYKGAYYENFLIYERLDSTVRAYAMTPRTYIVPWKEIVKTSVVSVNNDPYGIQSIITLKSGERLVGQITEQEISETMTLLDTDGHIHVIKAGDVLSIMSEKIAEKNTIWEQTPLLDRVVFRNGSYLEGFITSRLMGQYVNLLVKHSDVPQQIAMKDISKYQKTRNSEFKAYAPDTAKVVLLNDKEIALLNIPEEDEAVVYDELSAYTSAAGDEVVLSLKNITCDKTLAMYEYHPDENASKGGKKNNAETLFVVDRNSHPVYEALFIEDDGFMRCHIIVRKPGKYFLAVNGFYSGINLIVTD